MRYQRVAVTGVALACGTGADVATFWDRLCNGPTTIQPATVGERPARLARCSGASDDLLAFLDWVVTAARKDAGLPDLRPGDGLILGTNFGPVALMEAVLRGSMSTMLLRHEATIHGPTAWLAERQRVHGPTLTCSTACASGAGALGIAFQMIRAGQATRMLAGGYDIITTYNYAGLEAMKILSATEIRPFSADRCGTLLGEGAAVVMLEELGAARSRGARIYGEIVGYGYNNNAFHLTAPEQSGSGIAKAMAMALKDARLQPQDIGYLNAHGTGTIHNDSAETAAIVDTFGDHAQRLPVSSSKPIIGHTMGAAGALETIAVLLALEHKLLPPTHHYLTPDPRCHLDYIIDGPRPSPTLRYAMSNSYGIGGNNAVLILRGAEDEGTVP